MVLYMECAALGQGYFSTAAARQVASSILLQVDLTSWKLRAEIFDVTILDSYGTNPGFIPRSRSENCGIFGGAEHLE